MQQSKPRSKEGKALAYLSSIQTKRGDIESTASRFDIPPSTLRTAWLKLRKARASHPFDPNCREVLRAAHIVEARGATTHRLLTDDQEESLILELRFNHPQGFNDAIIKKVCRRMFLGLRDNRRLYSRHFLTRFKKRACIRRSKIRVHQRTQADLAATFDADVIKACQYLEKVEKLTSTIPAHLFINVDECPSYVRNLPTHALHFADSPAPWVWVRAKERDAVSVIGAVTGTGRVLHTGVIAKGSTTRCEAKFRAELPHSFIQHTTSGLTTNQSFIKYLEHVIIPYTKDQPALLIADAYKAHFTSTVKQFCKNHHLTLVKVPDRATAILQPLDVSVFGLAKLEIYQDVATALFEIDRDEESRWQATAECVKAIDSISIAGGLRGWKETFPFWQQFVEKS
jgi:transposase-like protein